MAIRGLPCITSASAIEGDTQKVDKLKKSCVILDGRGGGRKRPELLQTSYVFVP